MVLPLKPKRSRRSSGVTGGFPTIAQETRPTRVNRRASMGAVPPTDAVATNIPSSSARKLAPLRRASMGAVPPPWGQQQASYPTQLHSVYSFIQQRDDDCEAHVVEITGLELLERNVSNKTDDYYDEPSFDSYAKDSFAMAGLRNSSNHGPGQHSRMPNSSRRRTSMGSYANDSLYGYGRNRQHQNRRGSMGSHANDSIHRRATAGQRRASMGSYANDSVEAERQRARRRSSTGSNMLDSIEPDRRMMRRPSADSTLGNESIDLGAGVRNRPPRRSSLSGNTMGTSFSSLANDSFDFGRRRPRRRGSVGSYANDSVDWGRLRQQQQRRGSIGSATNDSGRPPRRPSTSSHQASEDLLELLPSKHSRRMSNGSVLSSPSKSISGADVVVEIKGLPVGNQYSFSQEILETQSIRSEGSRAA